MSPGDVQVRVDAIAACAGDDEAAHGMEDCLYADVLYALYNGILQDPQECARIALTTEAIHFARWCA